MCIVSSLKVYAELSCLIDCFFPAVRKTIFLTNKIQVPGNMALGVKSQCLYLLTICTTEWPSAPILYKEHSPASHMSSCPNSADRTKQRKTSQQLMIQDLQTCGNNHSKKQAVIA